MELKTLDVTNLKPVFAAQVDETKLPNMSIGLPEGRTLATRQTKRSMAHLEHSRKAAKQIGHLPAGGESLHCVLAGDYDLFSFVPACIALAGEPIETLYLCTLGFSRRNVDALAALVDSGQVRDVAIACSTYFAAGDADIYRHAVGFCESHGFRIKALRSHAKLLLMHIGDHHYVVESSANLRSCRNVEQATIFQSRELYDFHRSWLDDLLARAK